jgi:hypothetical protein
MTTSFDDSNSGGARLLQIPHPSILFWRLHDKLSSFFFVAQKNCVRMRQEAVTPLRQLHLEVDLAYDLVQQFARMLRTRTRGFLDAWLAQVESSKLPELQSFASGIEKDKDAVILFLARNDMLKWVDCLAKTLHSTITYHLPPETV